MKKSWILLDCAISMSSIIRILINKKRKIKARSSKLLILFKQISRFIGKLLVRLRKLRILKSMRVSYT